MMNYLSTQPAWRIAVETKASWGCAPTHLVCRSFCAPWVGALVAFAVKAAGAKRAGPTSANGLAKNLAPRPLRRAAVPCCSQRSFAGF